MRSRLWPQFSSLARQLTDQSDKKGLIELGPWLTSLAPHQQSQAEAQIEDFRERWASYLDDLQPFLEKLNESLCGGSVPAYLERPKKL